MKDTIRKAEIPYRLFIDDDRFPVEPDWFVARKPIEAIKAIQLYGWPTEIAWDHDLGTDSGVEIKATEILKWIYGVIDESGFMIPREFKYSVHSQNPIGAEDIRSMMDQLLKHYQEE